jgi:hypothetical protein
MKLHRFIFLLFIFATLGFSWPFPWLLISPNKEPFGTPTWVQKEMQILKAQASNIDDKVLRLGLVAYANAYKRGYVKKPILTIIDYSKPSSQKRLWVFDIQKNRILFNTYVTHGKNSGGASATSFSNHPGSLKSSIGVFVTAESYVGKNGYSLRLKGLEQGVNDHAYRRAIVIHGANYANPDNIRTYGQIGRSWGCPAVDANLAKPLINTIKENSLVVAYYPDRKWLANSRFLNA